MLWSFWNGICLGLLREPELAGSREIADNIFSGSCDDGRPWYAAKALRQRRNSTTAESVTPAAHHDLLAAPSGTFPVSSLP